MNSDHLSVEILSAFSDGELSPVDDATTRAHLNECQDCSMRVIETCRMHSVIKRAALCNEPSPEILARLSSQLRPERKPPVTLRHVRAVAWQAAAAVLLAVLFLGAWKWMRQSNSLAEEVLDQHLATLSEASQPEVASSDRHTVRPWFEGKLPFSFNLPEPNALPPDTVLSGANLSYVHGKPAALLLFRIHKHRTSVFVMAGSAPPGLWSPRTHSGFQIAKAKSADLEFLGVGDVNEKELGALVQSLAAAQ